MRKLLLILPTLFLLAWVPMGKFNPVEPEKFTVSTWVHGDKVLVDSVWEAKLNYYESLGITEILVQANVDFLQELVPLARLHGMKVHAWLWTLNRPNDSIAMQHPDWYAVNRLGQNSLEHHAYVDYYQWLSPFHPEAREYIKSNVRQLCQVEGLASVHLDYVRYVDVILGADLQPKYNLVQTTEMPEFDYDYHPLAREGFKQVFGVDPMQMEHPELSNEWRQYRLNAVTSLVSELADIVHERGIHLTAAVFPFPEMARQMVRQAWDNWPLDAAYPMLYHNFYRQNLNWIGFCTKQAVSDVDFPIHAGLYMPAFQSSADLIQAIEIAKQNGARGVSLFTADGLSASQEKALKNYMGVIGD